MKLPRLCTLAFLVLALAALPTHAHFIWLHVHGGARPRVEVLFGDGIYEDSETSLLRYVEGLHARNLAGDELEFEVHPWGLSAALRSDAGPVGATRDMGVFSRPGMPAAVKLDYYAKGALDLADAAQRVGTRAEIVLLERDGELVLRVLFDDAPAPGAEVVLPVAGSTRTVTRTTDENGELRVARDFAGALSLRALVTLEQSGEVDGEAYAKERHYAMLTVSNPGATSLPPGADPEAWLRLQAVEDTLERWPTGVHGLAGRLTFTVDERELEGEFEVTRGEVRDLILAGASDAERAFVAAELLDWIEARRASDFALGRGRYPITMDERTAHPLGRAILVGDDAETRVRVVDQRALSVERATEGERRVETVLEHTLTEAGRYLPTQTSRATFDRATGALRTVEERTDTYTQVDGLYLPATRRVVRTRDGGRQVMRLELSNLERY